MRVKLSTNSNSTERWDLMNGVYAMIMIILNSAEYEGTVEQLSLLLSCRLIVCIPWGIHITSSSGSSFLQNDTSTISCSLFDKFYEV